MSINILKTKVNEKNGTEKKEKIVKNAQKIKTNEKYIDKKEKRN